MDSGVVHIAVLAAALLVIAAVAVPALLLGSPPTPSSRAGRDALLSLLPAGLDGMAIEMGSGWGGLARALARRHPGLRVIAYERSALPWLAARLWQAARPLPNLTFRRADILRAPIGECALAVCYQMPPVMARLAPVLAERLPPGALVASLTFALPGWHPVATGQAGDMYRSPAYLYRVPDSLP